MSDLASEGKSDYFDGVAVYIAVKNNLQGIGDSSISLSNGKSAFASLAEGLKADGIQSYVADGYVKNATVFIDSNGDGKLSRGEWSGTTGDDGSYLLPRNSAGGKIIAFGGTDIMTGKPFQGVLAAPVGSTVVNPLTTLVQKLIEDGKADTKEKALVMVQKSLDLPENTIVLHYDPLIVLANANASNADKSTALAVQTKMLQVSNIISQIGSAIDAGSNVGKTSAADSVISALATIVAAGGQVNLSNADTLTNIVRSAAPDNQAGNIIINSAQDLAKITAASNVTAANAKDIVELSKSATVAQDSAVKAIVSGVTSGNLSGAVNQFTGSNLNSEINKAIPQDLTPTVPIIITPPNNGGGSGKDITPPKIKLALDGKMTRSDLDKFSSFLIELGQLAIENDIGRFTTKVKNSIVNHLKNGDFTIKQFEAFFEKFFGFTLSTHNPSDFLKLQQVSAFKDEYKEIAGLFAAHNMSAQDISNQFGTFDNQGTFHSNFDSNANSIDFIRLYFSEPVKPGNGGTIRIVENAPNIITNNINDLSHTVYFIKDNYGNPTNAVIIPAYNLPYNDYHIEIYNGAVSDVAGNDLVGSTTPYVSALGL